MLPQRLNPALMYRRARLARGHALRVYVCVGEHPPRDFSVIIATSPPVTACCKHVGAVPVCVCVFVCGPGSNNEDICGHWGLKSWGYSCQ